MNYLFFNQLIINFTSMKKALKFMFAAIILVALGTSAFSQVTANATVNATVVAQLTVANQTNIAFGQVLTGVTPTLDNLTGANTNCGPTATIGKFWAGGTTASTFTASWNTPIDMTSGGHTIRYTPAVSEANGNLAASSGGAAYTSGNTLTLTTGLKTFWIGGTLTETAGGNLLPAAVGVYSGTLTLTIQYN
jgi:hypothetical protein